MYSSTALKIFSPALLTVALVLGILLPTSTSAVEQRTRSTFDHVQTGFPLLGAHAQADCQTCHLQGIFKGTPRQCEYCHTQGSRIASTFKPANHPVTSLPCTQCHNSQATWGGARFDHLGVVPGTCATCHNGMNATGKMNGHVTTTDSCDKCHRTTAWVPAGYDHSRVLTHTCENCHVSGGMATPRPAPPHAATGFCDDCHTTSAWRPAKNHTNAVQGQCFTCHNGTTATGTNNSPTPHIPTNTVPAGWSCDACHAYTSPFSITTFTHTASKGVLAGGCVNCHSGAYVGMNALGMQDTTYNHFTPLSGTCDTCHTNFTSFKTYTFSHAGQGITLPNTLFNCFQCHNGSHSFSGGRLRGPDHAFVQHRAIGNCADSGCHTSLSDWGQKGDNQAYRRGLRRK